MTLRSCSGFVRYCLYDDYVGVPKANPAHPENPVNLGSDSSGFRGSL